MRRLGVFTILFIFLAGVAGAQNRYRKEVRIPDIPGYKTLKCDFHIHTVFSDGSVWPDIRSEEAWREGLDAIAITDHIEYQPHQEDLPTNHDRSYEIAKPHGDQLDILVIKGSEVTRSMPPGHLNAIFLENVAAVEQEEWRDAVKAAIDQGGFVFWNHPGWEGQQPDQVARWYPEHTELVEAGMLHGIEVVNEREYYPEAHRWCLDKKLTMLSNSDIHKPLNLDYHVHQGDHRPLTLVFATERTAEAIRKALFERRTAVYFGELLIGEEPYLRPIFEQSITVKNPAITIRGRDRAYVRIENTSDITYRLLRVVGPAAIRVPDEVHLEANATSILEVRGLTEDLRDIRKIKVSYVADNLKIAPDTGMPVSLSLEVTFEPQNQD